MKNPRNENRERSVEEKELLEWEGVCVGLKKGGDDGNNSGRVKQERRKEKGNW
jgi:hypothetical protein